MFFLIRKLYFPLKILIFDQFLPSYKESFLFLEILWGLKRCFFIIICCKIYTLVTPIKFLAKQLSHKCIVDFIGFNIMHEIKTLSWVKYFP